MLTCIAAAFGLDAGGSVTRHDCALLITVAPAPVQHDMHKLVISRSDYQYLESSADCQQAHMLLGGTRSTQ